MFVALLHFNVILARHATILCQQAANLALDHTRLCAFTCCALLFELGQAGFQSLPCPFGNGMFFGFTLG
ncbi:hypothetical protein L6R21_28050, partial [bacterium]|nr:hypothetical protein [bacterium]